MARDLAVGALRVAHALAAHTENDDGDARGLAALKTLPDALEAREVPRNEDAALRHVRKWRSRPSVRKRPRQVADPCRLGGGSGRLIPTPHDFVEEGRLGRIVGVAVISTDYAPCREELRGVAEAAQRVGWTLETIDNYFLGDGWVQQNWEILERADGVIARHRDSLVDGALAALGVPLVGLDVDLTGIRKRDVDLWASVNCDATAVAGAAARELLATGRKSFAVVTTPKRYSWTRVREKVFLKTIRAAGCAARRYNPVTEWDWAAERESLSRWLTRLPRPFGVFAPNDHLAKFTFEACRAAGLDVPRDAAIIGADDDATYCLAVKPNLSSVRIDFEGAGRLAAETLQRLMDEFVQSTMHNAQCTIDGGIRKKALMHQRPKRPLQLQYGILGVARRASTRVESAPQAAVSRIQDGLDFIAARFGDPSIGVPDVAKAMGVEVRQAARLFATTGKTIRRHIEETRLARIRELLSTTNDTIADIAAKCGFVAGTYFSQFVRARLGCSPTAWRKRNARVRSPGRDRRA